MIKIFVLASGRTGTKYLAELFENNIKKCVAKHEPKIDMFGKPIYWNFEGDFKKIRKRFKLKRWIINRYNADVFIETNHAFLKSFSDIAIEYFPDMKLVHPIRNVLEVAKSQYNRTKRVWIGEPDKNLKIDSYHIYTGGDGKKYCRWTLTGKEKIFQEININLSKYQKFLVQWIEIENRAMNFLKKYNKEKDCFTINMPNDLNNEKKINEMFNFFGLKTKKSNTDFKGNRNPGKKPTVVTPEEIKQLKELIENIPEKYITIFNKKPYKQFEWAKMLVK